MHESLFKKKFQHDGLRLSIASQNEVQGVSERKVVFKVMPKEKRGDDRRLGYKYGLGKGPTAATCKGPFASKMTIINVKSQMPKLPVSYSDMRSFIRPMQIEETFKESLYNSDLNQIKKRGQVASKLKLNDISFDLEKIKQQASEVMKEKEAFEKKFLGNIEPDLNLGQFYVTLS